jgi:hypothetical protein
MKKEIITTDNYLLVVDDSKIKDYYYDFFVNKLKHSGGAKYAKSDIAKQVIAHLPLNNSPILEGVDLLPPLEDEVEGLVKEHWEKDKELNNPSSFKSGYNKTKEKYKYTEEDILDAWELGASEGLPLTREKKNNLIKHLQQPKMPIAFECEINNPMFALSLQSQITTNSQGLTQWVGEYIY